MNRITIAMIACAVTSMSTAPAFAIGATAKSPVNVRSGPGTSHNVVDTLAGGEAVNVTECESGWCYVEKEGPDGWVSGSYLIQDDTGQSPASGTYQSSSGVTISPEGPTFSFSLGNGPRPDPKPKVCFFDGAEFTGTSACIDAGLSDAKLSGYWNDRISAIRVPQGVSVTLCRNWYYEGTCETYTSDVATLHPLLDDNISAYATEL